MSNELELMKTRDICEQLCITPRTLDRYRKRKKSENPSLIQTVHIWAAQTNG